jgi:hypothetical protein
MLARCRWDLGKGSTSAGKRIRYLAQHGRAGCRKTAGDPRQHVQAAQTQHPPQSRVRMVRRHTSTSIRRQHAGVGRRQSEEQVPQLRPCRLRRTLRLHLGMLTGNSCRHPDDRPPVRPSPDEPAADGPKAHLVATAMRTEAASHDGSPRGAAGGQDRAQYGGAGSDGSACCDRFPQAAAPWTWPRKTASAISMIHY